MHPFGRHQRSFVTTDEFEHTIVRAYNRVHNILRLFDILPKYRHGLVVVITA